MLEVEEWNYDANAINKKEMLFNLILSLLFRAPVCGNAHCALAPYWSKKLGKCDFVAYQVFSPSLSQTHNCNFVLVVINNNVYSIQASSRSGVLNIHLDEHNQRMLLRGKAVTVMEGSLLV